MEDVKVIKDIKDIKDILLEAVKEMFLNPIVRLTLGIIAVTVSLILVAELAGVVPDRARIELETRKKLCESLAMQLAWSASQGDTTTIQRTLNAVVERNDELLSASFLTAERRVKASAGDHKLHWVTAEDGVSTATHVIVPILNNDKDWGSVELSFGPLPGTWGMSLFTQTIYGLIIFMVLAGFGSYFLFMKRALKELDPSAVIPQRVRAAFDVMAEGLFIVDHLGQIVLANTAFTKLTGHKAEKLVGIDATKLGWRSADTGDDPEEYPWLSAIEQGKEKLDFALQVYSVDDENRTFMVNSSPILDDDGNARGALATFDDVTQLQKSLKDLKEANGRLGKSQAEVKRQNEELRVLATRDPLTNLLNRRASFERFEHLFNAAINDGVKLSCIMADIDHFKEINDRYGHAAGDTIIQFVAKMMQKSAFANCIVSRYGGEEFLLVMPGLELPEAKELAEKIRIEVKDGFEKKFSASGDLSISLGVACFDGTTKTTMAFVNQADQALFASKAAGRNKVTTWEEIADAVKAQNPDGDNTSSVLVQVPNFNQTVVGLDTIVGYAAPPVSATVQPQMPGDVVSQPNRVLFYDRVAQAVNIARRDKSMVGVLNLDLNLLHATNGDFEYVDDALIADHVSARLSEILWERSTVTNLESELEDVSISRLEAAEFGIAIAGLGNSESVTWIIQHLFESFNRPVVIDGEEYFADCTIGVSLHPNDGQDVETLVRHAITARQNASERVGRHKFMFYAEEMNQQSFKQMKIEGEMREAIDKGQLELYYQPAYDMKSRSLNGLEALIRWNHPEKGMISPDRFIPIAEKTGYIEEIGMWVLFDACAQRKKWADEGHGDFRVAINLSAVQFRQTSFVEDVRNIIQATGVDPCHIELEVTETELMADVEQAQAVLQQFREMGMHVAIDDFGTGYSSLSHLKNFVVDKLKIDKSFIDDVTKDNRDAAVVAATIAMSKLLNVTVTAEGVETEEQFSFLKKRQCDSMQGYLLSKPVTVDQIDEMLAERSSQTQTNLPSQQPAAEKNEESAGLEEATT
jgi:diguanylate cyclase (GGDEF)-like protein/PAS domain S-box-containing protein